MVAKHDDRLIGVELLVGTRGDFAHGHKQCAGQTGRLELPRLAYVEEERSVRLLALLGERVDGYWGSNMFIKNS